MTSAAVDLSTPLTGSISDPEFRRARASRAARVSHDILSRIGRIDDPRYAALVARTATRHARTLALQAEPDVELLREVLALHADGTGEPVT